MTKRRQVQMWRRKMEELSDKRIHMLPFMYDLKALLKKYEEDYSWMGDEIVRYNEAIKEVEGK